MSAARRRGDALEAIFRVGKRYRCHLTLPLAVLHGGAGVFGCEWSPALPSTGLTADELVDYRRGRDALVAEAARLTGTKPPLVLEL